MADAKLSELTAATAAAGDDSLYMVQSSASRKITVANFFGDVTTPAKFSDSFSIAGYNTQTSIGAVTRTTKITYLSDPDAPGPLTLEAGSEGQIKIIIMTSNAGGHSLRLNSSAAISRTVTFDSAGDTATLIYTTDKWYFIGGTATVL